jgi:hypothetical protein
MVQRTQISLDAEDHRRAKAKAAGLGVSLAEYIRRLVAADVREPRAVAAIDALFDLGASDGSDVAAHKDEYVGAAVDAGVRSGAS